MKPAIAERWGGWSGHLGARATTVLIECPLEEVLPLLAQHIEGSLLDLQKTVAVIASLTDLPRSNALQLLDDVTARVSKLQNGAIDRDVHSRRARR